MNGFTYDTDSYSLSYFQHEDTAFSSSNPILYNTTFDYSDSFSSKSNVTKESKKKRNLNSILDDFTYKLSLSVGTTIRRTRYHLLNYCYSQQILSFPNGNIPYNQYSIRIDQDKQYRVHRPDLDQLLSVDENEIIQQFVDEVLVLFDDSSESVCFQFIVTNDKVDGNGRVILHINPHPSRNLQSFQMDEFRSPSHLTRPDKAKSAQQSASSIPVGSSVNLSLISKSPSNHSHSILSRTSIHSNLLSSNTSIRSSPTGSRTSLQFNSSSSMIHKSSEEELNVGASLLTKLTSPSISKVPAKKLVGGLAVWSEQDSSSFDNDHVAINPVEGQRNSERLSALSVDNTVYAGQTEQQPQPQSQTVEPANSNNQKVSLSSPAIKPNRTPIPQVDELEGLFGHDNKVNQQLASVFSYGTAIPAPQGQATEEDLMGGGSFDSNSVFTEKEESEAWVFQRNPGPVQPPSPRGTDPERTSSVIPADILDSGKKMTLRNVLKGKRVTKRSKDESKTDDTDSSFSFSFDGSSFSETVTSRRSHTSNSQSLSQAEYCQFFGCHRTIAAGSTERNRCKKCTFLFCDEHKPRLQFINGEEVAYCDSCFNEMQKHIAFQRGKIIPEEPTRSSTMFPDMSVDRKPVVVSFFSHPLGIALQCGNDNRNACLLRFDRYDNNDNGMKVAIASYVLQINENITIDMDYVSIVNLIKKSSFPIIIIFGTLYDSIQRNIQNLLSLGEPKEHTCNLALCTTSITRTSSRTCVICERAYCLKHCRRLLFFNKDKPEYVCQFCFPCVFRPFDSKDNHYGKAQELLWAVQWVPDFMVQECTEVECSVTFNSLQFSLRKRRHHCRLCGNVFCDKHCSKRVVLTELGISDAVRVCNYCYVLIKKYREEL